MSNQELLFAIAEMMDEKLEQKLDEKLDQKLDQKLKPFETRFDRLEERMDVLEKDVKELKEDVVQLKENVVQLRDDMDAMDERVQELSQGMKCVRLTQENEILPKLREIESCYTGTYKRYAMGIDEHETMKQDIEVLKVVVEGHSEMLNRIAQSSKIRRFKLK